MSTNTNTKHQGRPISRNPRTIRMTMLFTVAERELVEQASEITSIPPAVQARALLIQFARQLLKDPSS